MVEGKNKGISKFPDSFNLKTCREIIKKKQDVLTNVERKRIHDSIMEDVESCKKKVTVSFSENLWTENRKIIAGELIDCFGSICIVKDVTIYGARKEISDKKRIPNNLQTVAIEFWK